MELNREQIIKALECQVGTDENHKCRGCFFYKDGGLCIENMSEGIATIALALIRALTEEKERLEGRLVEQSAENVMLLVDLGKVKADTVRKMLEAVLEMFPSDKEYTTISRRTVKRIAKEMLEETK